MVDGCRLRRACSAQPLGATSHKRLREIINMLKRYFMAVQLICCAASGQYEFSGYAKLDGREQYMVTDVAAGETSSWLSKGDRFRDIVVYDFDAKNEVLVVLKDEQAIRLRIRNAAVEELNKRDKHSKRKGHAVEISIDSDSKLTAEGRTILLEAVPVMFRTMAATNATGTITVKASKSSTQEGQNRIQAAIASIQKAKADAGLTRYDIYVIQ